MRLRHVLAVVSGVAVVGLMGTAPVFAANPEVNHFVDSGSFVEPDFCGTGQEIHHSFEVVVTEQLSPRNFDFVVTFQGKEVFTNPATGDTVIAHFAGRFTDITVSGDPEGIHTHEGTNLGLPEQFRLENGRVLTLDAGVITFRDLFDGDEFISGEIAIEHGPHPQADSDFELFCQILPEALGIE